MKKFLFVALLFSSTAAMAQDSPGGQGGGQQFEQRKAQIVQRIGDHIAKMQALQACAQAAADPQALRACMPSKGMRGGGGRQDGSDNAQPESDNGNDPDGQ